MTIQQSVSKAGWAKGLGAILGLALVLSAVAAPAWADRDDRDWRAHEVHARDWHRHYVVPPPHYVYAPPAVYVPPPEPSPGISLILPIHFH